MRAFTDKDASAEFGRKLEKLAALVSAPAAVPLFRVTTATWLGEAGVDATGIAAVTGHQSRAMTDHYTHTTQRLGRKAVEMLPDIGRLAGTDGAPPILPQLGASRCSSVHPEPPSRYHERRTGGGAAERAGLENRYALRGIVGSNPTLSASAVKTYFT